MPLTSPQVGNPIMRFSSPFVGIAFPTYQTCAWQLPCFIPNRIVVQFIASNLPSGLSLEHNDSNAQREWLTYWAVYGCFTGSHTLPTLTPTRFQIPFHWQLLLSDFS
jgi:hypothetical protein